MKLVLKVSTIIYRYQFIIVQHSVYCKHECGVSVNLYQFNKLEHISVLSL